MPLLPLGAREPLPWARFTGYDVDGGYAEVAVADERFCLPLAADAGIETAPLLCAGLIGYRALRMCGDAERLGLLGFGASAHLICQVAAHEGRRVFAVTREPDAGKRELASELGAEWTGTLDVAAGGARRGDHLRARWASWCRRRCGRWRREASSSAQAST